MPSLSDTLRRRANELGPILARRTLARGLTVTAADGSVRAIPVTLTPEVLEPAELQARVRLAALMAEATTRAARVLLRGPQREHLLGALSPLERALAEETGQALTTLATTRVDFLTGSSGVRPLEVNATIPAMQAYSDIAARALIETVGEAAGLARAELERLVTANGSNSDALHAALLTGFRRVHGPHAHPERLALLCRRGDSQLGELRTLVARFTELGTPTELVHPDEVSGTSTFEAHGKRFPLVYRHLFVRRLEEQDAPNVRQLLGAGGHARAVVLNPPASQVEVKAVLAFLSRAVQEPELARTLELEPSTLEALEATLPWTRLFVPGPARGPGGEALGELVAHVAAHPGRYVLKRSWDYGGRAVFIGAERESEGYRERAQRAFGAELDWPSLCAQAARDARGGGFVVQERIDSRPVPHVLCSPGGITEARLHVDFSAFASVGLGEQPAWSGVCRGAPSAVVNIQGGGGLVPLLQRPVADALLAALTARATR